MYYVSSKNGASSVIPWAAVTRVDLIYNHDYHDYVDSAGIFMCTTSVSIYYTAIIRRHVSAYW